MLILEMLRAVKLLTMQLLAFLLMSNRGPPSDAAATTQNVVNGITIGTESNTCSTDILVLFIGFRHGARNVATYLPNDENNSKWTVGNNALTTQGMKQHYRNGQMVRDKYAPLFETYDSTKLLARSSDLDRTIMSGASFMASLVQPKGKQIFQRGFNWQPAAIYTTAILAPPLLDETMAKVFVQIMPDIINSDPETMATLAKASGIDAAKDTLAFAALLDNLVTERFAGFNLPYGLKNNLMPKIQALKDKGFIAAVRNNAVRCLLAPPILHDLIDKVEKSLRNETTQFIYIWSMHDNNVFALLSILNDYQTESPSFAATLFFEIRNLPTCKDYEIKFIYRKDLNSPEVGLEIKGCSMPCTLTQFKTIVQKIENDCGFDPNSAAYASCYGQ